IRPPDMRRHIKAALTRAAHIRVKELPACSVRPAMHCCNPSAIGPETSPSHHMKRKAETPCGKGSRDRLREIADARVGRCTDGTRPAQRLNADKPQPVRRRNKAICHHLDSYRENMANSMFGGGLLPRD